MSILTNLQWYILYFIVVLFAIILAILNKRRKLKK